MDLKGNDLSVFSFPVISSEFKNVGGTDGGWAVSMGVWALLAGCAHI